MVAVIMAQCLLLIDILLALIYRFVIARLILFLYLAKMAAGYADVAGTFDGSAQLTSTRAKSTATNGGQIYLNGLTGNRIDIANVGMHPLSYSLRSTGTKICFGQLLMLPML